MNSGCEYRVWAPGCEHDKAVLVSQIISQRHMHEVAQKHKSTIQKWRKRAVTQEDAAAGAPPDADLAPITE